MRPLRMLEAGCGGDAARCGPKRRLFHGVLGGVLGAASCTKDNAAWWTRRSTALPLERGVRNGWWWPSWSREATTHQVRSCTVELPPLAITDAMPASRAAALAYILLEPMTWWLAAFRLK